MPTGPAAEHVIVAGAICSLLGHSRSSGGQGLAE
jgi:hypothetical protein